MNICYVISTILIIKAILIECDYECNFYNERTIGELLYLSTKSLSIHSRTVSTWNALKNQENLISKANRGDYYYYNQDPSAVWYLTPVNRTSQDKFYIRNAKTGEYMYVSRFSESVRTLKSTSDVKNFKHHVENRHEFIWQFKRPWTMINKISKQTQTMNLADKYTILNVAENRYLAMYKYMRSGVFVDSSQPHGPNFNWIVKCKNSKFVLSFILNEHLF